MSSGNKDAATLLSELGGETGSHAQETGIANAVAAKIDTTAAPAADDTVVTSTADGMAMASEDTTTEANDGDHSTNAATLEEGGVPHHDGQEAAIDAPEGPADDGRPATTAAPTRHSQPPSRDEDAATVGTADNDDDDPRPQMPPLASSSHQMDLPPTRGVSTESQRGARSGSIGTTTAPITKKTTASKQTMGANPAKAPPKASERPDIRLKAAQKAQPKSGANTAAPRRDGQGVPRTHSSASIAPSTTSTATTARLTRLDKEGLDARHRAREMEATHTFWSNRLHLLRREVEAARIKAHMRRLEDDNHEAATLANATIASQLRAERQQQEASRLERSDMIRQQREERRVAFRATLHQNVLTKMEDSRRLKAESCQQRSMVEQLRQEVLESKRQARDKVIEEKAKAVEKRRKEQEVIAAKARRLYEIRIEHLAVETHRKEEETRALVEESGKLLEQLRKLQRLDDAEDGMVTAEDIERAVQD